jgi:hypothetical protein
MDPAHIAISYLLSYEYNVHPDPPSLVHPSGFHMKNMNSIQYSYFSELHSSLSLNMKTGIGIIRYQRIQQNMYFF